MAWNWNLLLMFFDWAHRKRAGCHRKFHAIPLLSCNLLIQREKIQGVRLCAIVSAITQVLEGLSDKAN